MKLFIRIIVALLIAFSLSGCKDSIDDKVEVPATRIQKPDVPERQNYISYDDVKSITDEGNEFAKSIFTGDKDKARELFNKGNIDPNGFGVYDNSRPFPFLVIAVNYSRQEIVKMLLEKGADINVVVSKNIKKPQKPNSYPVIEYTVLRKNIDIAKMIFDNFDENDIVFNCLDEALSWGVDIDTPPEIVKILLDKGAKPNYTWDRVNPITEAAENKNEATLKLLLSAGADINELNNFGELLIEGEVIFVPESFTALDYAKLKKDVDMANLLKKFGAKTS